MQTNKSFLIVLAILIIGSVITYTVIAQNQQKQDSETNTPIAPTAQINNSESETLSRFTENDLLFTFDHPASWGNVSLAQETESFKLYNTEVPVITSSNINPTLFVVLKSPMVGGDRGAFWGDLAWDISNVNEGTYCDADYEITNNLWNWVDECETFTNDQGVLVTKASGTYSAFLPEGVEGSVYLMRYPGDDARAIVFTDIVLKTVTELSDEEVENGVEEVVRTFEFTKN